MAKEIERKYLVDPKILTEQDLNQFEYYAIRQAYLTNKGDRFAIRARTKAGVGSFCIKSGGVLVRDEYEYKIPLNDAEEMIASCDNVVDKTRYQINRFELDVFHLNNDGLVLLEVELKSEGESVTLPEWMQPYIIKEVTTIKKYTNQSLAFNKA